MLQVSVVVPVHNEGGNIGPLVEEVACALRGYCNYEVLVVDDHSSDNTAWVLQELRGRHPELRVLQLDRQAGQSTALYHGIHQARAPWVVTLDGDGQNDPADIPALIAARDAADPQVRLLAGWRTQRQDSSSRRWASRLANALRMRLLGDATPDTGCGIKLIERATFLRLPYFDHMHRYLPALVQRAGQRTLSVPVHHRPRAHGQSKYTNLGRALVGVRDLFGVAWLIARNRPCVVVER